MSDRTEIFTSEPNQTSSDANLPDLISGELSNPMLDDTRRAIGAKNRIPYETARHRIVIHSSGLQDVKAPFSELRVHGDLLTFKDEEFRLDAEGLEKLAGHFHAPAPYLNKLSPEIRDAALNYHLKTTTSRGGNRIFHRNGRFVGFGRSDLRKLEAHEVLDAVREGFDSDAHDFEALKPELDNDAFSLNLVSPRIAVQVRVGDDVQAGVRIEHSLTGDRATVVYGFVERLVCSNGMISRQCVGKQRRTRRLNADREDAGTLQYDQIVRLAIEVRKELAPKLDAIKKLTDERADEAQLRRFLSQARMNSEAMLRQLQAAWEEEGNELTAFGLFNALTRLATHGTSPRYREDHPREAILSHRQRAALSRLAGIYAGHSVHLCPQCFSVLNGPSAG